MFKIETIVYVALVICGSASAHAQNNYGPRVDPQASKSLNADWKRLCKTKELKRENSGECLHIERQLYGTSPSANAETCREAEQKFNDAAGKFSGTCGTAGLDVDNPSEEGKTGAIGCSWSKNRCVCLSKKVDTDTSSKYRCSELSKSDRGTGRDQLSATTQSIGGIDIGAARKRMEACPHEDPDDTDRYDKQLEKAQERTKEAKKKMAELTNKASEAQDKANQAENDARKKAVEKQKELAKELQDIKRKKEGEEQQAVAEMTALREKMDQTDSQIRQLEMSKIDAEVKLSEARTAIELNCHSTASQQVAALQTAKMASIRSRQSQGDFTKLMNSVGLSSRANWMKQADKYYIRCLNSRPTRDSKQAAKNIYDSTLRQVDSAISSARKSRFRMEENITQIMTSNGCTQSVAQPGGFSGESKMCRSARQAFEEAATAQQSAYQEQQQIQQEALTAKNQLLQKNQVLGNEYMDAQREMAEENQRMANLRAYLNLKREKSNGVGGKEAAKAMNEAYGALESAANTVVSCHRKEDDEFITPEGYKKAWEFLDSIGQTPTGLTREFVRRTAPETPAREPEVRTRTSTPTEEPSAVRERRSTPEGH